MPDIVSITRAQLATILDFFFEAAIATYAAEVPTVLKITFPDGSKGYKYASGDLRYEDHWFSSGNNSFGWTVIFLYDKPIWWMHYAGCCNNPDTILFLRACLREAYRNREFLGGRGPKSIENRQFVYFNNCSSPTSFKFFDGHECIMPLNRQEISFYHRYSGGLMCGVVDE